MLKADRLVSYSTLGWRVNTKGRRGSETHLEKIKERIWTKFRKVWTGLGGFRFQEIIHEDGVPGPGR